MIRHFRRFCVVVDDDERVVFRQVTTAPRLAARLVLLDSRARHASRVKVYDEKEASVTEYAVLPNHRVRMIETTSYGPRDAGLPTVTTIDGPIR